MAAAKKVATKTKTRASKKDYAKVELPKGFTAIASGSFGEVWEYEQHPVLVGKVVGDVRSVTQKAKRKGEKARETRVITVKSEADGKTYTFKTVLDTGDGTILMAVVLAGVGAVLLSVSMYSGAGPGLPGPVVAAAA